MHVDLSPRIRHFSMRAPRLRELGCTLKWMARIPSSWKHRVDKFQYPARRIASELGPKVVTTSQSPAMSFQFFLCFRLKPSSRKVTKTYRMASKTKGADEDFIPRISVAFRAQVGFMRCPDLFLSVDRWGMLFKNEQNHCIPTAAPTDSSTSIPMISPTETPSSSPMAAQTAAPVSGQTVTPTSGPAAAPTSSADAQALPLDSSWPPRKDVACR